MPALATTSPSSITTGPARSEDEQSRLSCGPGPGRVDRPRRRRRSATRGGRSRAGKHRRRAFRGALHAPRRCERRRGLVASSRLRLPQFLAFSNTFFEAQAYATLPDVCKKQARLRQILQLHPVFQQNYAIEDWFAKGSNGAYVLTSARAWSQSCSRRLTYQLAIEHEAATRTTEIPL